MTTTTSPPGADTTDEALREVLAGLRRTPPSLSPRWLYDPVGSALFEAITRLAEYGVFRVEMELLSTVAEAIGQELPAGAAVVELGIGSPAKARLLLSELRAPREFVGVDVSRAALALAVEGIESAFPGLPVAGWPLDFTEPEPLGARLQELSATGPVVVFFPGSTIGNFDPAAAAGLLAGLAARVPGGTSLILGLDLVKSQEALLLAYDDPAGVTAAFNRNALAHLNARFGFGFDPRAWRHEARWNAMLMRVEMWLVAERDETIDVGGVSMVLPAGTELHTESSHKYDRARVDGLAAAAGWECARWWEHETGGFALAQLVTPVR